jgi:hypothetical protein
MASLPNEARYIPGLSIGFRRSQHLRSCATIDGGPWPYQALCSTLRQ